MKYKIAVVVLLFTAALSIVSVSAEEINHNISYISASSEYIDKNNSFAGDDKSLNKSVIEDIVQMNKLAEVLMNEGDYENARAKYQSVLKAIEDNEEDFGEQLILKEQKVFCYIGLGKANYFLNNFKEAADIYGKVESSDMEAWLRRMEDENKVGYYLYYGNSLTELGNKQKAEDYYLLLNEAYKRLFDPLIFDGERFVKEKEYQKAIDTFQKSLEARPMNIEAYISIAKTYVLMGYYDEAIEIYDYLINNYLGLLKGLVKFEEVSMNSLDVYYSYGRERREAGDIKGAIELFESGVKRVELYDENSKAEFRIAKVKRDLYFELGYSYYLLEEYRQAAASFETLENNLNPQRNYGSFNDITQRITSKEAVDYYLYYAISLEKLGRDAEASVFFREANKYCKKYPDDTFLKGKSYFDNNDFENAIDQFERSIVHRPNNMEAYYYIAKAYLAMSDMEKAQKITDHIISQNISDIDNIYLLKSVIEQINQDYKQAALEKKSINKRRISSIFGITLLLMMLVFRIAIQYAIKEKKLSYSNALDKLYKEIENHKTMEAVTNEAAADMSGFES